MEFPTQWKGNILALSTLIEDPQVSAPTETFWQTVSPIGDT